MQNSLPLVLTNGKKSRKVLASAQLCKRVLAEALLSLCYIPLVKTNGNENSIG
jgi:Na+/melibiose symporter-like transporter